jgi:hypothetical protein
VVCRGRRGARRSRPLRPSAACAAARVQRQGRGAGGAAERRRRDGGQRRGATSSSGSHVRRADTDADADAERRSRVSCMYEAAATARRRAGDCSAVPASPRCSTLSLPRHLCRCRGTSMPALAPCLSAPPAHHHGSSTLLGVSALDAPLSRHPTIMFATRVACSEPSTHTRRKQLAVRRPSSASRQTSSTVERASLCCRRRWTVWPRRRCRATSPRVTAGRTGQVCRRSCHRVPARVSRTQHTCGVSVRRSRRCGSRLRRCAMTSHT